MTQVGEQVHVDSPVEEEDEKEDDQKEITLRISLYFDGTGNNRLNTEARKANSAEYREHGAKPDSSYQNEESNISYLHRYIEKASGFDHSIGIYIEGIGTQNLDSDTTRGYALGKYAAGITDKVNSGFVEALSALQNEFIVYPKIKKLVLDVFGFSRGAAAARYFIYKAMNNKRRGRTQPRHLARRLRFAGFAIEDSVVEVKFAGLFDTVASYGLSHTNDTETLQLDSIAKYKVEKTIQLASADEHRSNFSLTNIESVGGAGKQIFLPGVHSDIGGGYTDTDGEDKHLYESYSKTDTEALRNDLILEGWYKPDEITIRETREVLYSGAFSAPQTIFSYSLHGRRARVRNGYSAIPLQIMADFARQSGVGLKAALEMDHVIPADIASVGSTLKSYAQGSSSKDDWFMQSQPSWLPELRNKYLHYSAHLATVAVVIKPNKPNFEAGKRARVEHYG
jgi:Uncharacterized conserved protein (DUF2235).